MNIKEWKKIRESNENSYLDRLERDGVSILVNGYMYIKKCNDVSHSELFHDVVYGYTLEDEKELRFINCVYCRDNIQDKDVQFGHIIKKSIYWEILQEGDKENIKKNISQIKDYTHYYYLDKFSKPVKF